MAKLAALKDGPCADCHKRFHHAAMQWDHRPGEVKVANVSILARSASMERILLEIAKCDLVCANCHAIRSFDRKVHG